MKEEPFFLVNEFLDKEKKQLEKVIDTISSKNTKKIDRAIFLRNFTNEIFKAHRKTKKYFEKKETDISVKQDLLIKKEELLKKLQQLQGKEKNYEINKNEKIHEEKQVILSRETGKILVKNEFDGKKYYAIEPDLTGQDITLINELKTYDNIINKDNFKDKIKSLCVKYKINYDDEYYDKIRYYIIRDTKKFGKISPLVEDKDIAEIICSGINTPIMITYKGQHEIQTNIAFASEEVLNNFLIGIVKKTKNKVSPENPFININMENINVQGTIGNEFVKPKFIITKQK